MLFSTATAYALQTLAALPEDGQYRLARDIAEQLDLPGPYLAKILQALALAGILESVRGPRGGFRFARPTGRITVKQVLHALEGQTVWDGCVMGFPDCGHENPCPLHHAWGSLKVDLECSVAKITVRELKSLGTCAAPKGTKAAKKAKPSKAAGPVKGRKSAKPAKTKARVSR